MSETKQASSHLEVTPNSGQTQADHATLELYQSDGAILLDIAAKGLEGGEGPALKLAKDGHVWPFILLSRVQADLYFQTVLVPRPSDDPKDPLNWSETRKNLILLVISISAFMGDFQAGVAIPCIIPQAKE